MDGLPSKTHDHFAFDSGKVLCFAACMVSLECVEWYGKSCGYISICPWRITQRSIITINNP